MPLARILSVAVLTLVLSSPAFAAETNSYQTGDSAFDSALIEADTLRGNDGGFLQQLALEYSVPVADLQALRDSGWKPGEILLAVDLAQAAKKPLKDVTASWKSNKGKGWGAIAQSLGVKPGSDAFKALKQNAVNEKDALKAQAEQRGGDTMMRSVKPNQDGGSMKKGDDKKKP